MNDQLYSKHLKVYSSMGSIAPCYYLRLTFTDKGYIKLIFNVVSDNDCTKNPINYIKTKPEKSLRAKNITETSVDEHFI